MKFTMEIDLARVTGDPATELGRILRYWGGSAKQLDLTSKGTQDVYDSDYVRVGEWRLS